MAREKGKFIVGSIGPVVYKVLNGVQTLQSKPGKIKQTKATKKNSRTLWQGKRPGKIDQGKSESNTQRQLRSNHGLSPKCSSSCYRQAMLS